MLRSKVKGGKSKDQFEEHTFIHLKFLNENSLTVYSQEAEWLEGFLRGHELTPDLSLTTVCGQGPLLPPPQLTGEKLQGNGGNGSCVVLPLLLQALPSFQLFLLRCFGNWLQLILPEQLSAH